MNKQNKTDISLALYYYNVYCKAFGVGANNITLIDMIRVLKKIR